MINSSQFYNKIAQKFGGYKNGSEKTRKFQTKDPEKIFKDILIKYAGEDKTVLDLGCADGRFSLDIAPYFQKVIAIDLAQDMLDIADKSRKAKNIHNVEFKKADASNLPFKNEKFDLVYSRRGPTQHKEISRVLKPRGYFIEIRIGEQDSKAIKEVFGRGQGFGKWKHKVLETDTVNLKKYGFKIIFAQEYFYSEFFKDYKNLDMFLQSVPILPDFDSEKDKPLLQKYVDKFQKNEGIELERHRLVFVAIKI